ncbi:MAG: hypothetical protein GY857_20135, partial [Desulfobacula sp.]|nr:hypothetical protein [Desulfobacula sp.]
MLKDDSSIQTKFFTKMIYIVTIAASLWFLIWIGTEILSFKSESDVLRAQYIVSQKTMLKTQVTILVNNIKIAKKQIDHTLESKPEDELTL